MKLKLYKLLDKATGLYKGGGDYWTKRGKTWNDRGHLKTALLDRAKYLVHLNSPLTDEKREKYYSYLPESWVVVEIGEEGFKEVCTARDFWKYHG